MTCGRPPRRWRRRRRARQASTVVTHISCLGEDLLLEIFLRLSSFATLVRAALTCRAWRRAVASSPDFRRRFRALHQAPPLLGMFRDSINMMGGRHRAPCAPSFFPAGFRDWDLAGVVRGGDFFLTSLLERSTKNSSYPNWEILDCCGGRVLLTDNEVIHDEYGNITDDEDGNLTDDEDGNLTDDEDRTLIVLNPLVRRSAHEFREPGAVHRTTSPRLICLDEEPPSSFRVVILAYAGDCKLEASVFSSDTGEWTALPAVDVPARSADGTSGEASEKICIRDHWKMRANGFVYWIYMWCGKTGHEHGADRAIYLISLNTTTMEFCFAELPQCLWSARTFHAGETEDGAACFVYTEGYGSSKVGVVKHTRGGDGVDRWVPDRVLHLEVERLHLGNSYYCDNHSVLAVRDGYVYFSTSEVPRCMYATGTSWFMSLCLATKEVEKLFRSSCDKYAYAYIMPWPPCLLSGNYGQFAFECGEPKSLALE